MWTTVFWGLTMLVWAGFDPTYSGTLGWLVALGWMLIAQGRQHDIVKESAPAEEASWIDAPVGMTLEEKEHWAIQMNINLEELRKWD